MTSQYNDYFWNKNCHTGNTVLYVEPNGGKLMIGGWTKGASFDWNTHVIDLTGTEHKFWDIPFAYDKVSAEFMPFLGNSYAGWLSLPFPDYQIPSSMKSRQQWEGVAGIIRSILKSGRDVLVACHGGHGRSGLFCAIVGYMLAIDSDYSWSSPVEKVRKMHCEDAVETYQQEKFVYDILGLDIQISHTYVTATKTVNDMPKYINCPICGTQSTYVQQWGMCYTCHSKYDLIAPSRHDLTLEDIKHKGEVEHSCNSENCMGIWKADVCKHVTHDMIIYEGLCEICWQAAEDERMFAEQRLKENPEDDDIRDGDSTGTSSLSRCAVCDQKTMYAHRFGICYECSQKLATEGNVDFVHNTITDPYRAFPHHCTDDVHCVGIVVADVCGHVLHNQEVEDGKCPECLVEEQKRGHKRGITHLKEDE